jgi:type I restriction enzyme S subunit
MEEIKQGYKQTDIGVIPEDWEVISLDSISNIIGDGIHTTPIYTNDSEFKFINGNNLKNCKIELNASALSIPLTEYIRHKKQLNSNTVLYSINGTIGNIAFYDNQKIILGKSAAFINLKPLVDKRYIFYILQSNFVLEFYENEMTGSTIRNLSLKSIRSTPIPWSSLPSEQTAIANALSDTDALITALDKKIAKKQQIKQGAMQQLLTGKKRLPGFSGEWVEKTIGDALSIKHGRDQKQIECLNGKYPILGTGGVIGRTDTPLYSKESVLIGRKGTIDKPYYYDTPFWTVDTLFYSEINSGYDAKYLFYIFNQIDWYLYNEASGVPSLNAKVIELIKINIPKTKAEQTAMAQILTDMDNEIAQLEKERNKYKELKAGMMQVLLTGKIRLI